MAKGESEKLSPFFVPTRTNRKTKVILFKRPFALYIVSMSLSRFTKSAPSGAHGLSAILDRVTDAIISVDSAWRITFVNATAAALAGKDAYDLMDTVI